jgi:hypothetical protein
VRQRDREAERQRGRETERQRDRVLVIHKMLLTVDRIEIEEYNRK